MRKFILFIPLIYCINAHSSDEYTESELQQGVDLFISMLLLIFDEPMNNEVIDFIDYRFKNEVTDNAHVYLWGMDLDTDDPYAAGQYLIKQINIANANYKHELEPYDHSFLNEYTSIKVYNQDFFCTFPNRKCLLKILKNTPERATAKQKNLKVLERYHRFFTYQNFEPLHRVNFETPLPNYRFLSSGNQLAMIEAMELLDSGNVDLFFVKINRNLSRIKTKMSQAKTLISQMVLLSMVDWNIELISQLLQSGRLVAGDERLNELLKPLNKEEKSTKAGLVYDLSNWMHLQRQLFENSHFLIPQNDNHVGNVVVRLLMPLAFKSNLTLNIVYHESIKPTLKFIESDAQSFYKEYAEFDARAIYPPLRGYLSNYLASFMTDDMDTWLQYPARMHSMDMGIQLVRAWRTEGSWEGVIQKASDGGTLYLSHYDGSPPFFKDKQICYAGLFEYAEKNRCILILD